MRRNINPSSTTTRLGPHRQSDKFPVSSGRVGLDCNKYLTYNFFEIDIEAAAVAVDAVPALTVRHRRGQGSSPTLGDVSLWWPVPSEAGRPGQICGRYLWRLAHLGQATQ